jgi:hypothetical protein
MESPSTNSSSSSYSFNTDSTYIFGYSDDVNLIRHLHYSNSVNVNLDFIKYTNLCKQGKTKYNSKIRKHKLNILLESLLKKNMVFYNEDDYKDLQNLIKSYNTIRNYIKTFYKLKNNNFEFVNDCTLLLQPIESVEFVINLKIRNKIYRYSVADIIQIYNHALKHIDEKAYINGELESPKNPYTNLEFTFIQNVSIYQQLLEYYKQKKGYVPNYIVGYKECYFETDTYFTRFYNNIMNTSIKQYLDNCSDERFEEEFNDMVRNASNTMRQLYCPKCYKRHNIRILFSDAVKMYILNSNEIYLYGYYENVFKLIAETHELNFDSRHSLRHRKRIKSRNNRRSRVSSPGSSTSFNFTISNSESISENILTTEDFIRGTGNLLPNTTSLFSFSNVIPASNINNTMLNHENLFDFSSPNNPIFNQDNVAFNFSFSSLSTHEIETNIALSESGRNELNSPLNLPQVEYLTNTLTTSINSDIRPLRLISDQHFDAALSLSDSSISLESPNNSNTDESVEEINQSEN